VGPEADQFVKIPDLFRGMVNYNTLGLVWFDKDQQGVPQGQDWRIEGDYQAEVSFRLGVSQDLAPEPPSG